MNTLSINIRPKVLYPPTVDAGPDVIEYLPSPSLSITAVGTDDGTIVSYLWTKEGGSIDPGDDLIMDGVDTPTVTLTNMYPRTLVLRVTVTDDDGLTGTDTVSISLIDPNLPPVADAGGNKVVNIAPSAIKLDRDYIVFGQGGGVYRFKGTRDTVEKLKVLYDSDGNSGLTIKVRDVNTSVNDSGNYHIGEIISIEVVGGIVTGIFDLSFSDNYNPVGNLSPISGVGNQIYLQIIFQTTHFVLDGSHSYDPEMNILQYQWSRVGLTSIGTLPTLYDDTASIARLRNIVLYGVSLRYRLRVEDVGNLVRFDQMLLKLIKTVSMVDAPLITKLGKMVDSNSNNIGQLKEGGEYDLNGVGRELTLHFDMFVVSQEDVTITLTLTNIYGIVSFTSSVLLTTEGAATIPLDLRSVLIGTINSQRSYILNLKAEDVTGRVSQISSYIKLYNSDSSGMSTITVNSENITGNESTRVVTVNVPSGETRLVDFFLSSGQATISPPGGIISSSQQYTMVVQQASPSGGVRSDSAIIRSLKGGAIEATNTLIRLRS